MNRHAAPTTRLELAARVVLAAVLLWAGAAKAADARAFLDSLWQLELPLTASLLRLIAAVVPWLEIVVSLLLFADIWPREARLLALALTAAFLGVTLQAWFRGLDADCGCFGVGTTTSPVSASARNTFLALVALWLWLRFLRDRRRTVD